MPENGPRKRTSSNTKETARAFVSGTYVAVETRRDFHNPIEAITGYPVTICRTSPAFMNPAKIAVEET